MKLAHKLVAILAFFGFVLVGLGAIAPSHALAAGPQCFASRDNIISGCHKVDTTTVEALEGVSSLPDNKCYLLTSTGTDAAPGIPTVTTATVGDSNCNSWTTQAHQTSSSGAKCFKITGANINVGTWTQNAVPSGNVSSVSCTHSLITAQPSSSGTTSFADGRCYLIFSDHSIYDQSCASVMQEIAAANGAQTHAQTSGNNTQYAAPAGKPSSSLSPSAQEAQIQQDCKDNSTAGLQNCVQKNPLIKDINDTITLLSGAIGVIVLIMIIVGGMQYMSAGGNAQKVTAAKGRITNAVLSLLALVFLYAFLQWVIPGGPF